MKALLVADTLKRYPDHNLPFHIFTDGSDFQLRNFQRVLLYVIECGSTCSHCALFFIYNTLHRQSTSSQVQHRLRWRLYIEEFLLLTFHDVRGTGNVNYYRFYLSPPEA